MDSLKLKPVLIKVLAIVYLQIILIVAFRPLIVNFTNIRAGFNSEFGSLNHAITLYNRVLFLDKDNLEALTMCGYVYQDLFQDDIAAEYYKKAIKYHPDNCDGYYFYSLLLMREQATHKQAMEILKRAVNFEGSYQNNIQKILKKIKSQSI
jgi:tetratricopeptide (TPR) repeat protein